MAGHVLPTTRSSCRLDPGASIHPWVDNAGDVVVRIALPFTTQAFARAWTPTGLARRHACQRRGYLKKGRPCAAEPRSSYDPRYDVGAGFRAHSDRLGPPTPGRD